MTPEAFASMLRSLPAKIDGGGVETMFNNVGDAFRAVQLKNFEREADENNTPWPPRKKNYPWPILRKTRKMMRAATQRNAIGNIQRAAGRSLVLGIRDADVPYAKHHHWGSRKLANRKFFLPRRRFFYLRAEDKSELEPAVRRHLLQIMAKAKEEYSAR